MNNTEAQELNDRCCQEIYLASLSLASFQEHWEKASAYFANAGEMSESRDCEQYQLMYAAIMATFTHIGFKSLEMEALLEARSMGKMKLRGSFILGTRKYGTGTADEN